MLDAVRETVRRYRMLEPGGKIIVGVSGGADSAALLHILLRGEFASEIVAAHINHGLRGEESDGDERFVWELCGALGVELRVHRADVKKLAAENNLTLEEAGRQCRYAFFNAVLKEKDAQKIAVAHSLNDSAETVVFNLCRGTGLAGLAGIPAVRGKIIRPLINCSRLEIEKYLKDNGIPFRTDGTNLTDEFTRGRVRRNVLPMLTAQVNGNAVRNIARCAAFLRDEEDFMERETERAFNECAFVSGAADNPAVEISLPALESFHPAVIRRVVRRAYGACAGTVKDLTGLHTEQVMVFLESGTGKEACLPAGVTVRREYSKLIFTLSRECAAGFSFPLEWEKPVYVPSLGKTVAASLEPPAENRENACTKAFRCDRVSDILFLRTRMPGDRITLKGTGTRKLQDYFTDRKIPRHLRDTVPLLAHGGDILWIMDEANRVNINYLPAGENKNFYVIIK